MNTTTSTSNTPRTDSKAVTHPWVNGEAQYVSVEFARELERENAELRIDKERLDSDRIVLYVFAKTTGWHNCHIYGQDLRAGIDAANGKTP